MDYTGFLFCLLFSDASEYEAIWSSHVQDKELLAEYAKAMHHLATEIWANKHSETRIDWCRKTCTQFFFSDDGLKKQLEKDRKRKYYAELNLNKEKDSAEKRNEFDLNFKHNDLTDKVENVNPSCSVSETLMSKSLVNESLAQRTNDKLTAESASENATLDCALKNEDTKLTEVKLKDSESEACQDMEIENMATSDTVM